MWSAISFNWGRAVLDAGPFARPSVMFVLLSTIGIGAILGIASAMVPVICLAFPAPESSSGNSASDDAATWRCEKAMRFQKTHKDGAITRMEFVMLLYCTLGAVVGFYCVFRDLMMAIVLIPSAMGGVCIALMFLRLFKRRDMFGGVTQQQLKVRIWIMPVAIAALSMERALTAQWLEAGFFLLILGFLLIVRWDLLSHYEQTVTP